MGSSSGIWVFGYGSLVWNPGFDFVRSQIGYIRGYDRRFWQGNDKHRGTPEKGQVWGRAFLLSDDDASARDSLGYLDKREAQLGGYSVRFVQFRPRDPREEAFPALVYIATPNNPLYLGPASAVQLADEVLAARGFCGANAEYVLKLARFMKEEVPDAWDDHLFTLESLLRTRLKDSWKALQEMSAYEAPMSAWEQLRRFSLFSDNGDVQEEQGGDAAAGPAAEVTSDFVSNVPTRKLRCLDI
ncbi:putative glutathione-specific gamma-glutamylcyclotransferase 2 isoform X2 [Dermacentor andersoni]|uniref:putative glutathione-specific gamma-glutamylcyclotransferase 2 isoform X2 n=1 Tax=Dermacentor andersoni TaxID=34620 RepID=UPI002155B69F|nr:putative glutathione-specific gamma-glutamylcyclotransferase 2 isoform X2 [Dermacentor andersoni]